MKIMNKFGKGIIAVVLCLLLATTAWAAEQIVVSYSATFDDDVLCINELMEKTVKLTAKAGELVEMDAFTAQVKVPEGWEIKGIANDNLEFGDGNFSLENGMIMWYSDDAENVSNDLLADVTIQIPNDAEAGDYEIVFEIIDISRDWGMPWESGKTLTAKLTVADHADGDDADHECDTCGGAVEGEECVYVPGEPVWSEDNMTVTVTGTCACGETATATAEAASTVTAGNCQNEEITTYTATFAESWFAKTVTKEVKGEKDADVHVGEQKTEYINNGDDHTVKVAYAGCGHVISENTEDHTYVDGKCVCGAEKPEEPTDPDPSEPVEGEGLKGDVTLDGMVDMDDVVALMQHVLMAEVITDATALTNGEVTNDTSLDMDDVVKLMQYVLKAIDSLD